MKYIITLIMLTLISGCAGLTSPARKHELDKDVYWIEYDATRRGSVVALNDKIWKSCAEPTPDVAISTLAKLEVKIGVKGELTQNIVNLAEKTQMVLFLRESLFRLCEISINNNMPSKDVETLYKGVMNAALALVTKESKETDAKTKLVQERMKSANRAEALYKNLIKNKVKPEIIQNILKNIYNNI
ncbi:hypothetical protein SPONN_265 [uncultured Candidatus Thioglobus sp.]|nr:hypothetical protein SPONN_265 [uncultured Candidatus Thioglobus sp.]